MKLEEELQQEKFRSEFQKLNLNLLYTSGWIENKYRKVFENQGISASQYNVLRILKGNYPKPYTTSQIRERMLDKMSDASRIVDRLCHKKLVERKVCQSDRRLVDVVISERGLKLIRSMSKAMISMEKIFHKLSEQEANQINKLLDKLRDQ